MHRLHQQQLQQRCGGAQRGPAPAAAAVVAHSNRPLEYARVRLCLKGFFYFYFFNLSAFEFYKLARQAPLSQDPGTESTAANKCSKQL